jgi:histidine triad (HIT) family protein
MTDKRTDQAKLFEMEKEDTWTSDGTRSDEKANVCAFCKIVNGAVSRHVVLQDEVSVAFLDRRPVFPGHCLLVPKKHYETLSDLPSELIAPLFANAQLLVKAVQSALRSQGSFVAINNKVSQSVPHLHIHVVPRRPGDGLRGFFWPRQTYQSEQQKTEISNSIIQAIEKIRSGHLEPK